MREWSVGPIWLAWVRSHVGLSSIPKEMMRASPELCDEQARMMQKCEQYMLTNDRPSTVDFLIAKAKPSCELLEQMEAYAGREPSSYTGHCAWHSLQHHVQRQMYAVDRDVDTAMMHFK